MPPADPPAMPAKVRVKICGIAAGDAFDAACEHGADWIGFVFFPPSPRAVTPRAAARLSARLRGGPGRIGLFVDPDDAAVAAALDALALDGLQLHRVAPGRAAALRARFGVPVWRAVAVNGGALPETAEGIDALLLDAPPPPGASRPGGNAHAFDWGLLRGWTPPCPWLLAGGLTPDNVARATRDSGAGAVDVSSGVESSPGRKDAGRIAAFIRAARS